MVQRTIQIKAPIQTVFDCIVDFESYPKFLSDMKSAKVGWVGDNQMEVTFKLNLIKEITYTLRFELDPPGAVFWKLKSGDWMKTNSGSWELKMKGEDWTEAAYSIDLAFSLWVPRAVTDTLVEKNLPQTLQRFKKRAEKSFRDQGGRTRD